MKIEELILKNRNFMKSAEVGGEEVESDQMKKLPQPPLYKQAVSKEIISLPEFNEVSIKTNLVDILYNRKSSRVFSDEPLSLEELSFLLWACQGVKEIRGNNFATIRTVPCGGARHPFEAYMIVNHVTGLKKGLYHYLPEHHELEFLKEYDEVEEMIDIAVAKQSWAKKCAVAMFFSFVAYRSEWRYSIYAQRSSLMDIGFVGENLYLSAEALEHTGSCALASYDQKYCDTLFNLDGTDEYVIYSHVIGKTQNSDAEERKHFFAIHQ